MATKKQLRKRIKKLERQVHDLNLITGLSVLPLTETYERGPDGLIKKIIYKTAAGATDENGH
jgi:hypothetical protein